MPVYVVFEGTTRSDQLQSPHLGKQPGLIEEINYGNQSPNDSMLLSSWMNEETLVAWQILPIHLRIEKAGREKGFSSYRIIVGWEEEVPLPKARTSKPGHYMVLYQHPKISEHTLEPWQESIQMPVESILLDDVDSSSLLKRLLDHSLWLTETHILHVSGWPDAALAEGFEHSIKRVPGNWLHGIAVDRDYTGQDKDEAPRKTEPDDDIRLLYKQDKQDGGSRLVLFAI
ncbi:hypothetical protein LTR37_010466 [Vermiconidia calcicola]|uniref:Uncharacterized protein n=1 Tax=Vermiconidia calcicola TaxID=1690605 RepID=A0ACC3N515_9PEZI|nr:hypothetical protein LTR37_010466 [Vermiconidia calcicola]